MDSNSAMCSCCQHGVTSRCLSTPRAAVYLLLPAQFGNGLEGSTSGMRLEWRALARALQESGEPRLRAIREARLRTDGWFAKEHGRETTNLSGSSRDAARGGR